MTSCTSPARSKAAQLAARQAEAGAWLAVVTGSPLTSEAPLELRALSFPPQGPFIRRPRYAIGPCGVFYDQHLVADALASPVEEALGRGVAAYGGLVAGAGAAKNLHHWRHRIVWLSKFKPLRKRGWVRTWELQEEADGWKATQHAEEGLFPEGTRIPRRSLSALLLVLDGIDGVLIPTEETPYQAPTPPARATFWVAGAKVELDRPAVQARILGFLRALPVGNRRQAETVAREIGALSVEAEEIALEELEALCAAGLVVFTAGCCGGYAIAPGGGLQ